MRLAGRLSCVVVTTALFVCVALVAGENAASADDQSDRGDDPAPVIGPLPKPPTKSEVLAAGDTPAERLCAAEPSLFGRLPGDASIARDLMAGKLTIPPFATVTLPTNPTWSEVLVPQSNWETRYQALTWLDPLRREFIRSGDTAMRDRYQWLIRDFLANNPSYPTGRSPWTWYDQATGQRSSVLACASSILGMPSWLVTGMRTHVAALSDPSRYKGRGNHSLMQNSGLYSLGCVLPSGAARGLATDRSVDLLFIAIDSQGVSDEGSFSYQGSNYVWWSELRAKFVACGESPPSSFSRIDRMPQFIADATQPTGRGTPFGDTQLGAPGRTDIPPSGLTAFYGRGYLFSRSGTGTERPLDQESMLSLRYGQTYRSAPHGHMDAGNIEFFAYGKAMISDSGMYAYGGGYWRGFVKSNVAHNVMAADGAAYRQDRTTPLKYSKVSANHTMASIATTVITGANWTRTVVHSRHGGWILIDDQVHQTSKRTLTQRWNLPRGSEYSITGGSRLDEVSAGADVSILFLAGTPQLGVRTGWRTPAKPYTVGWRSLKYAAISASPTLEARKSTQDWHIVTLLAARPTSGAPSTVKVSNRSVSPTGISVTITTATSTERVSVRPDYFAARVISTSG
jgi:hypothetical protein